MKGELYYEEKKQCRESNCDGELQSGREKCESSMSVFFSSAEAPGSSKKA